MASTLVLRNSDIARCPITSLSAGHYRRADDGTIVCACTDTPDGGDTNDRDG